MVLVPACAYRGTSASHNSAHPSNANMSLANEKSSSPKFSFLQLMDRDHWLVADLGRLWKTDSGGRTWKQIYSPEPENSVIQYIRGINFINVETGFLIDRAKLYRTDDGGNTWNEVGPIQAGDDEYDFENCYFVDSLHGWVVGAMHRRDFVINPKAPAYVGAVLATQDGGNTWQRQSLDLPKGYFHEEQRWSLNDVFFFNQQTGWAAGDRVIFWTVDGGKSWQLGQIKGENLDYKDIRFLDNQHGWATVRDGVELLVTKDGGRHWKMLEGPDENMGQPLEAVFLTPEHGFAALINLYETKDGGRSWIRRTDVPDKVEYRKLRRALDGALVAIGFDGGTVKTVISTSDGLAWHSEAINQR